MAVRALLQQLHSSSHALCMAHKSGLMTGHHQRLHPQIVDGGGGGRREDRVGEAGAGGRVGEAGAGDRQQGPPPFLLQCQLLQPT